MGTNPVWGGFGSGTTAQSVRAQDLIYHALRLLQVLRPGQTASPETLDDGLSTLNAVLGSWSNQRLLVWQIERQVIEVAAGQTQIGIGGPMRLERASRMDGDSETPIDVLDLEGWRAISSKSTTGCPVALYADRSAAASTAWPWPVPDQTYELVIYTWEPFSEFSDLTATVTLPAGYSLALRYNLAMAMAPAFQMLAKSQQVLLGEIRAQAQAYRGTIKSLNARAPRIASDFPGSQPGSFDYRTGGFR